MTEKAGHGALPGSTHVVMIVGNEVTPDTRVKKTAVALSHAGLAVTVLGITHGSTQLETNIGDVRVLRVPLQRRKYSPESFLKGTGRQHQVARSRAKLERTSLDAALLKGEVKAQVGWQRKELARRKEMHRARAARVSRLPWPVRSILIKMLALLWKGANTASRIRIRLQRMRLRRTMSLRDKRRARYETLRRRAPSTRRRARTRDGAGWRQTLPVLHDFELALGPVIDSLRPDVVHAHDMHMIGIGARAAARQLAAGRTTHFVYDAHEYVRGVDQHMSPDKHAAYLDLEKEYIHRADRVVTVSSPLARRLQEDYELPALPTVVMNVPIQVESGARDLSVRATTGLGNDVPLVVYSGRIHPTRDVATLVRAVAQLEDVHLALVSERNSDYLEGLVELAREADAAHRLHVVPYVSPGEVTTFLASADIGVNLLIPCLNHEVALPNKFFEYLYAGLPVVNSDVGATAALVEELRCGTTFRPGDPDDCARSIVGVLDQLDELKAHIGSNRRTMLSDYTWEAQQHELISMYSDLLGQPLTIAGDAVTELEEIESLPKARSTPAVSGRHLLVGPVNINAWEMARVLQRELANIDITVQTIARTGERLDFPADIRVDKEAWRSTDWQLSHLRGVLTGTYTHVLHEGGMSLFGALSGGTFEGDLILLRQHGIRSALWFHGSDIRDPRRHRALEEFSPFSVSSHELTHRLQRKVDALRPVVERHPEIPAFVTTMDLLDYVPNGVWTPVAVDLHRWRPITGLWQGNKPVVGHVSTSTFMKGGSWASQVCERLADEGLIEYRAPQRVAPGDMPAWMASIDVFIDGLLLGDYGAAAAQAMATERIVVGNIAERVRQRLPAEVPIVSATPRTLEEQLRQICRDRDAHAWRGAAGRDYTRTYHSGSYAAAQLAPFLGVDAVASRQK